jgi:hypothetical protein
MARPQYDHRLLAHVRTKLCLTKPIVHLELLNNYDFVSPPAGWWFWNRGFTCALPII